MALNQVGLERLNTATTKKIGQSKNLIINGAMQVAQRGTSTTSAGYQIDRFAIEFSGTDEAPTYAQADVASGTTPYTNGFRKSLKITNGNQTSGAGAGDNIRIYHGIEAQNLATSGWNYTSSSSNVTLSFWVKSSVAQNFYGVIKTEDGTQQNYPFETGSLTADTWTKVTKQIPGNSNITIDNNNGSGAYLLLIPFHGTNFTGSVSLNAWGAYSGSTRTPDMTSTWYTTNDATFEITGVQLEVGSVATDFEHKSFAEDLTLCQRYFQLIGKEGSNAGVAAGFTTTTNFYGYGCLPGGQMRAAPTIAVSGTLSHLSYTQTAISSTANNLQNLGTGKDTYVIQITGNSSTTGNAGAYARIENASSALTFSSEL